MSVGKIRMIIPYHLFQRLYNKLCKNLDAASVPFVINPIDLIQVQDGSNDGLHLRRVSRDDVKGPPLYPMIIDESVDHFRGILMRRPM